MASGTFSTPPGIFRAYFDVFHQVVLFNVQHHFDSTLKIGLANWGTLAVRPVEWAKAHLNLLIKDRTASTERWIKDVCDVQTLPEPEQIQSQFEEVVFWRKWRAPKFIYMHPAGNAPYVPAKAWEREDEPTTWELLASRSKRFVEFLSVTLEQIAGTAHVAVAQEKEYAEALKSMSTTEGSARGVRTQTVKSQSEESPARLPTYQSVLKRAILMQFLANPTVTDIEICRMLDAYGDVELPDKWKTREFDRQFEVAYRKGNIRPRIEVTISKIRCELRKRGLIPPR